jgi:hypothetical protein
MDKLIDSLQELIYTMFTLIEEGNFDDSAEIKPIANEAIERANQTLAEYGADPITYDMWRAEHYA